MTRRKPSRTPAGTTYLVLATTFRGHPAGATFIDTLEPALEQRAVDRGQLQIVSRSLKSSGRPARPAGAKPGTRRTSADTHNGGAK